MKRLFNYHYPFFAVIALLSMTSCDDGYVNDPTYDTFESTYTVKITGTFTHYDTWQGTYSVAAACYAEGDEYSLFQKVLPSDTNDSTEVTMLLTNVPTKARTVEIAVVGTLRDRIATIHSYDIPSDQRYDDTIRVDVGTLDVGMFSAINKFVFQNTSVNCSRCHASAQSTAHLDLTEENAYKSLVNVPSYKDSTLMRVKPYDAENSYLYRVLSSGVSEIRYNHPGLMSDYQTFLSIMKSWINGGAKE